MSEILIYQRLHPRAYLERFIAESIRPDGRGLADFRELYIAQGSIGTADGSALVKLGDTMIVCGVKGEIAEPELDAPSRGFIVPNVEISAICSPKFKPGPPSEEAQILSEQLNQIITKSKLVDPESLCIHPGKAVWTIYIDAVCINYDGNALDATLLAMGTALRNTRLPQATYSEDRVTTICSHKAYTSLNVTHLPIAATFGLFDTTRLLADPTSFEEPLLDSTITVILQDSKVILVSQSGTCITDLNGGDPMERVKKCIALAKKRQEAIKEILEAAQSGP